MDEKDQKPITVDDILDQITKTQATPNQGAYLPRPNLSPRPSPIPHPEIITPPKPIIKLPTSQPPTPPTEIRLPSLGKSKESEKETTSSQTSVPTESRLKLSIRTMASDLAKIKQGQKPLGEEVGKDIIKQTQKVQPIPQTPIPQPNLPQPISKPQLQDKSSVEEHYHPERIIAREKNDTKKDEEKEQLPDFLGDKIPRKKSFEPEKEKVKYGLIAKVIGSGMTTGIVSTVALALIAYFTISYFFFKQEEIILPTPTPVVITSSTPVVETNEINTIFSDVFSLDFQLPENKENTILSIKSFINEQIIDKKEFRRLNIINQSGQTLSFKELLENITTDFPLELENFIKSNHLILVYGQEESFTESSLSNNRLVLIVEINNAEKVSDIIRTWESTLPNSLESIFELDITKESSSNFLDNERRGVQIRYKNFPLPDRSLDYSIVSSLTGRNYLVITNSRESMYSPTDRIRGL